MEVNVGELIERVRDAMWPIGADEPDARAAIATVFDWLAENDDIAIDALAYPASKSIGLDYWPVMLASLRKSALG